MNGRWPNLFLIGAPRCATTSLFAYLSSHPDVFGALEKEPHFYDRDILGAGGLTRAEYHALFAGATTERWLLEASTLYLFSHEAPTAIARDAPEAHVVVSVRDPIDFIASWHALLLASGAELIPDLEDAIAAESRRRRGLELPPNAQPWMFLYSELAQFAGHIERWRAIFGDRVHVVLRDDLDSNPAATAANLVQALGLQRLEGVEVPRLNPSRRVNGVAVLTALNGSAALRSVARAVVPHSVRRFAWHRIVRALTPVGEREPVSPELRSRLEPLFTEEFKLIADARTTAG